MKNNLLPISLILISLCCSDCTPIQKVPLSNDQLLLEIEWGPSRRQLPMFKLSVYLNQIAVYEGKRYTPKLGTWVRELSKSEWQQLQQQLPKANIWAHPPYFRSTSTDLPLVTITQYEEGISKSVAGKDNRPADVLRLESLLITITQQGEWVEKTPFDFELPKDVHPNQLRVELRPGVYVYNWVARYRLQKMTIMSELSEKSNYWLVTFDPSTTFPREMEQLLRYDNQVLDFAFHKIEK